MSEQDSNPTEQPSNVLPKGFPPLTESGDIGAAGIGLAVGYFGDVFLLSHFPHLGVSPSAASIYFSSAVVGIKRTVQAWRAKSVAKEIADEKQKAAKASMRQRADFILATLDACIAAYPESPKATGMSNLRVALKRDLEFYIKGIITPEQFQKRMDDTVGSIQVNNCPASAS